MRGKTWVYDPHSGGVKIPPAVRQRITERIQKHAQTKYAGKFTRLEIRFHGALCYIDAFVKPEEPSRSLLKATGKTRAQYLEGLGDHLLHLCRLRYFGDENAWSLAFYTYSHERYEPSVFENGTFHGTPEEAFDVGAVYLLDR
jgi:hypothetical protein